MLVLSHPELTMPPSYPLYGEGADSLGFECLHLESIDVRSRLHEWEIKPHQHDTFLQILYIASGHADAWIDAQHWSLRGPCMVLVPARTVHGFRFDPEVVGQVLTVRQNHLSTLLTGWPVLENRLTRPQQISLPRAADPQCGLPLALQALGDEYAGRGEWRAAAIDACLLSLALALGRSIPECRDEPAGTGSNRAPVHLLAFRGLVEARFREQPRIADLARELGISATQLNRICQRLLGHPALAVLHERLMLEARRQLTYTGRSIKHIAFDLGFADAGYFSRFFMRHGGCTPTAWRTRLVAP
jgi:AraC family transcriptional activator of pobA